MSFKIFMKELAINESGMKGINNIAKQYKESEIYFHNDLDGVTSAITAKEYLSIYGIKTIAVHKIGYGQHEFSADGPINKDSLKVLVDFAHGKSFFDIHIDHHQQQSGVRPGTAVKFNPKAPSTASVISDKIAFRDIFPQKDIEVINMIDSSAYANSEFNVSDVMSSIFSTDMEKTFRHNHHLMGFVVNKLILAYKNKPGFLETIVMKSKPSLLSIFNNTRRVAIDKGYMLSGEIEHANKMYVQTQEQNIRDISDFRFENGTSALIGKTIIQFGGGDMFRAYDRYTPFHIHPESEFLLMGWPDILTIQISTNSFKQRTKDIDFNIILKQILNRYKDELLKMETSLEQLKTDFERPVYIRKIDNVIGFTLNEFLNLMQGAVIKGMKGDSNWKDLIDRIMKKPLSQMTVDERKILSRVKINTYDIVEKLSGGHKLIVNVQGLNFAGIKGKDIMKRMMVDIAKLLKPMSLN